MHNLLVQFKRACRDGFSESSHFLFERLKMTLQDGRVDLAKRLLRRERDVEDREERDEPRINFVTPTTSLCTKKKFMKREVNRLTDKHFALPKLHNKA